MKEETKFRCCRFPALNNNKLLFESKINYTFCKNCGNIFLKSPTGIINHTVKSSNKKKPVEFNPIEIINSMKKKTEAEYPFLNEEYNIGKNNKEEIFKSINSYLNYRDFILSSLNKIMSIADYSDLIFYQSLFYIDTYLSHNITEKMTEKIILYYLIGFFLISSKTKETDIYEPDLDSFLFIKKNIYLSLEKIAYYEVICLQTIKYNIFCYSAYDWISELSSIGFIFDCEINKNNEIIIIKGHRHSIINTIYKYCMKILLNVTTKNIFIKYSPMYIAFSLIRISREKFLDKNIINNNLYNNLINLFGVNFEDYKTCYEELKSEIKVKNFKLKEINENAENYDSCKNWNISSKPNNNINNKMKSSTELLNLQEMLINPKNEDKERINTEKYINYKNINNENKEVTNDDKKKENINSIKLKDYNSTNNKDENIIIYDENNEEKNNDMSNPKLDLIESNDNLIFPNRSKIKGNQRTLINFGNKEHLFIDCDRKSYFKSNKNLNSINNYIEGNSSFNKKTNNCESKENSSNSFLKSSSKSLNKVKVKKSISLNLSDKRQYIINSFKNDNDKKEKLNTMKKSLFFENVNKKNIIKKNSIDILNSKRAIKLSNFIPNLENVDNLNNEENNSIKEGFRNTELSLRNNCKSKEKSINSLAGKETKIIIANKRNLSNKQIKRIKSKFNNINENNKVNNIKWKK